MSTITRRQRRTQAEWDELARELRPRLQAGERVSHLAEEIGTNDEQFRVALARIGSDPRGNDYTLTPISGSTEKTLAKRIAKRRQDGAAWWEIMAATGRSYGELNRILRENGFSGRGEPTSNGG